MNRSVPRSFVIAFVVIGVAILIIWGMAIAGAISTPRAFTENDNGTLATVNTGDTFNIDLAENPSTGYSWNMTVSDGLKIVSDRYIPPAQQIPGRGGVHEWTIEATGPGRQTVSGIYKRPWEPLQNNETTYMLNLNVGGSNLGQQVFTGINGNTFKIQDMLKDIRFPDMSLMFKPLQFDFKDSFPL